MDDIIIDTYQKSKSIKKTAKILRLSESKVKKELITAGIISTPLSIRITRLLALGFSVPAIAKQIGVSIKVINVNIPYSRCRYKKH